MKIVDVEQNTPEWEAVRLGKPTASEFHRIITAVKGDLSEQARGGVVGAAGRDRYDYAHRPDGIGLRPAGPRERRGSDCRPCKLEDIATTRCHGLPSPFRLQ